MSQTEFIAAIRQIASERGIEADEVVTAMKNAIKVAFKNDYPEEQAESLEVEIDMEKGSFAVYADRKVVEEVTHPATQISLTDAKKVEPRLRVGDHVQVEVTQSGDFGRVAAQAARQVIVQLIRESEKEAILQQFTDKIGTIDSAVVQRMDRDGNVLLEINRATAKMPPEEQIGSEFYRSADRIKVLLKEIHKDAKGKILIVSRADPAFLRALFEMEVPEIASGTVEIMAMAREEGSRSKVAVRSNADGVDPIGSCVGQRGARINAITNELKGPRGEEKIDIIPWDADTAKFIGNAVRPAQVQGVKIINERDKQAVIIVNDDDLSLAIGREGQNVRLAAKLTGWKLEVQGKKTFEDAGSVSAFEGGARAAKPAAVKEEVEGSASGIAALGLATRVVTALEKAGITDEATLRTKLESGEKIAGVGDKSVLEIKEKLGM